MAKWYANAGCAALFQKRLRKISHARATEEIFKITALWLYVYEPVLYFSEGLF